MMSQIVNINCKSPKIQKKRASPPPIPLPRIHWVHGYHKFEISRGEDFHKRFKIMEIFNQRTRLSVGMTFCLYYVLTSLLSVFLFLSIFF